MLFQYSNYLRQFHEIFFLWKIYKSGNEKKESLQLGSFALQKQSWINPLVDVIWHIWKNVVLFSRELEDTTYSSNLKSESLFVYTDTLVITMNQNIHQVWLTILRACKLTVWKFKTFFTPKILREIDCRKYSYSMRNVMFSSKWPKLISRKIQLVENYSNFYTVRTRVLVRNLL